MMKTGETVVLPFPIAYIPIKKLALINFEKEPDKEYTGLELQYLSGEAFGSGYRIIAWRLDGYVDVYDEFTLTKPDPKSFQVAGRGLKEYYQVAIQKVRFEKGKLSFKFTDKRGRRISVFIEEHTSRKTKGISLLAPVGSSSKNPVYLPLIYLVEFDFLRKKGTEAEVKIAGKKMKLDSFPFPSPKDWQWRFYTRWTMESFIIEFAEEKEAVLKEWSLNSSGKVVDGSFIYHFHENKLTEISFQEDHPLHVQFQEGIPDIRTMQPGTSAHGVFSITAGDGMGKIEGTYSVERHEETVELEMVPDGGWVPEPKTLLTKILFHKKSMFCSWPKTYRYRQTVHLPSLFSKSVWERIT
jgi:hypothetical protein